jgi:hypothetical protein
LYIRRSIRLSGSGPHRQNYDERRVDGFAQHGGVPYCGKHGTRYFRNASPRGQCRRARLHRLLPQSSSASRVTAAYAELERYLVST